ncbi:hypothetical protein BD414DRAFT_259386 [Trametes punicea]|nr:hypothetical protein BD414DRAFT_259386 [Trametes punicea]
MRLEQATIREEQMVQHNYRPLTKGKRQKARKESNRVIRVTCDVADGCEHVNGGVGASTGRGACGGKGRRFGKGVISSEVGGHAGGSPSEVRTYSYRRCKQILRGRIQFHDSQKGKR